MAQQNGQLLQNYFRIVRRWLWLLVLAATVAGLTCYWVIKQTPPTYQAQVQLVVGPGVGSSNPDLNALRASGQLMQTYAKLVTTRPFLQDIVDSLNLNIQPSELAGNIVARADTQTQILRITVQGENGQQTLAIANAIAEALVRISSPNPDAPETQLKAQLYDQAKQIEESIVTSQTKIKQLDADLQSASADEQRLINNQLSLEQTRLYDARRTLGTLYSLLEAPSTNQVSIIEPAASLQQAESGVYTRVLIAAVVGLILGLAIALVYEYFDDTIRSAADLIQATDAPFLGAIAKHQALSGIGCDRLVTCGSPDSRAAESFRVLGSKLALANGQPNPLRSVLVISPDIDCDTGEIVAELAIVMAQTGSRVILVDANLRRPTVGQLFDITAKGDWGDVVTDPIKQPKLVSVDWAPGLSVLPGDAGLSNPFEQLASQRMAQLIEHLKSRADMVIISGPPSSLFAESLILASRVDGVVLVARNEETRSGSIHDSVESLRSLGAHIIGTVLDHNRSEGAHLIPWGWKMPRRAASSYQDYEKRRLTNTPQRKGIMSLERIGTNVSSLLHRRSTKSPEKL